MHVAIAGAGIAGLTAATALARRGFDVTIFERAPALAEIGAGIQLAPNATALLQRLGLADRLAPFVDEPSALEIRSAASGRRIVRLPLGAAARERYGAPYWLLHRADLQKILATALGDEPRIRLRLGEPVIHARAEDGDSIRVETDRAAARADLLVAADGIHSTLRTSLFGLSAASPLGAMAWRTLIPAADVPKGVRLDATTLWMGAGFHVVHYPLRRATILNLVLITEPGLTPPPPTLAGAATLRALLEAAHDWTAWPLSAVPRGGWIMERAVLVGDAAHAMAPSAAQGGAQAIEDAVCLAESLADHAPNVPAGLAAYQRIRRPRIERVATESARNLRMYGLEGIAARLRDTALATAPSRLLIRRLDWLFSPPDRR